VKGRFEQPDPVRNGLQAGFRALIRRSTKGAAGSKEDSARRFLAARLMPCMPAGVELFNESLGTIFISAAPFLRFLKA
jgi:hypothetical protein